MKRGNIVGVLSACGLALSALGQTRVTPQCHAWVLPGVTTEDPSVMVPMVVVWVHTYRPEWGGAYYCLNDPHLAAKDAAYTIMQATWASADGITANLAGL